jgi:transglutaminase-like putative cysteine protease
MNSSRKILPIVLFVLGAFTLESTAQDILSEFNPIIKEGEFTKAQSMMRKKIASNPDMNPLDRLALEFEAERLNRIRKDFTKTKKDIIEYIQKYIPDVTDEDLKRWEEEKSLECRIIDHNKWYFNGAASNLFRIDKAAKAKKEDYDRTHREARKHKYSFIEDAGQIVEATEMLNTSLVKPKRFKMTYTLTVHADAVPEGEVIRAWLPYAREGNPRQVEVHFHYSMPPEHIISDNDAYKHRTIYLEKNTKKGEPTVFEVCFEYKSYAQFHTIDPEKVQPYDTSSEFYKKYTAEKPPHIVFSKEFKKISKEIVGDVTNPYLKAKKIFQWVDEWTPWAGAREYSTMKNIPMYCYENKHGDCGMQTLFFMTLARMSGIPVHWQSGWWIAPGEMTLHDWCEIYLEPYGWLLVDQSFGIKESDDVQVKWFCLGNTDGWRWIINDDFSQPFYPAKMFPRSETVDFQRGEVEWRGGNLYFDQWNYDLRVELIE